MAVNSPDMMPFAFLFVAPFSPEENLNSCAVWNRSEMNFEVFEERTSWDLMGGEWATSSRFSGNCVYQGVTVSVIVKFPIYGRLGNIALRSKPKK